MYETFSLIMFMLVGGIKLTFVKIKIGKHLNIVSREAIGNNG